MFIEVTSVEALADFRLRLAFNDGAEGIVDARPFLWGEQFEALLDPARFREVFLDHGMGTIAWPNHADLAPEALREHLTCDAAQVAVARPAHFA